MRVNVNGSHEIYATTPRGFESERDGTGSGARAKEHLKKAVISHLRRLQKSPKRVALYFMHKPIRYAALFKMTYSLSIST
ncbi:MAG: hypothetical protein VB140_10450 [Burkholderia sp.]